MAFKISVIIPNYNGLDLLAGNLPKIIAYTQKYDPNSEIIVVDDGSEDASVSFIKNNFPGVRIIKLLENYGFSRAMNSGIKAAKGDLVVLLNNDVTPNPDYLKDSVRHFSDQKVFAVSFHEKGYGWASGNLTDGFVNHKGMEADGLVHETFWVNGGSGIFRKSQLKILGNFDEKLFSPFYWEDIDLCYRAAKRGWRLLWEPNSVVYHIHGSTINKVSEKKKNFIVEKNQLLFIWKNITSPILFRKHILGLIQRTVNHPGYVKIVLAASKHLKEIILKRRKEKKEATVSDETIFLKFS